MGSRSTCDTDEAPDDSPFLMFRITQTIGRFRLTKDNRRFRNHPEINLGN